MYTETFWRPPWGRVPTQRSHKRSLGLNESLVRIELLHLHRHHDPHPRSVDTTVTTRSNDASIGFLSFYPPIRFDARSASRVRHSLNTSTSTFERHCRACKQSSRSRDEHANGARRSSTRSPMLKPSSRPAARLSTWFGPLYKQRDERSNHPRCSPTRSPATFVHSVLNDQPSGVSSSSKRHTHNLANVRPRLSCSNARQSVCTSVQTAKVRPRRSESNARQSVCTSVKTISVRPFGIPSLSTAHPHVRSLPLIHSSRGALPHSASLAFGILAATVRPITSLAFAYFRGSIRSLHLFDARPQASSRQLQKVLANSVQRAFKHRSQIHIDKRSRSAGQCMSTSVQISLDIHCNERSNTARQSTSTSTRQSMFSSLQEVGRSASRTQFIRPHKQPMHEPVIDEDDDMTEAGDDHLTKLMKKYPKLSKGPVELYWDLRVFGLQCHEPVYITLNDALEVIGGDRMLSYWQLTVIIPRQCKILWFCSLQRRMKNDLKNMLQGGSPGIFVPSKWQWALSAERRWTWEDSTSTSTFVVLHPTSIDVQRVN
ncbi:hypothetical protein LR48_Vigan08g131700 [Vigna angularis]|uniref:Uncharacterized protein n=1 Tax=Phaseolus angularis TaxID=3914 RepID=A0A0L9V620_PHAAN|nr:hypothetical protein LR48_Vigan08g131700 [Vigna angularis]